MNTVESPGDSRLLERGCAEIGAALVEDQRDALLRYLDLLYVWNRAAGLTTIERPNAVRLHLLDSLAALPLVTGGPCLDLGTGAGLPGLVLAVARPDTSFVLVESNRRKCSFLLEAVRILALHNVEVVRSDVDAMPPGVRYPVVMSRAFRQPPSFLSTGARLVAPGGSVVLLTANPSEDDLDSLAAGSGMKRGRTRRLVLPGGSEPRAIAEFFPG